MDRFKRKDDFCYLKDKYPHICFHYLMDKKEGKLKDKKYVFGSEGYITVPQTYQIPIIQQFSGGLITFNRKFVSAYKSHIKTTLINGYPDWNNYYELEDNEFTPYIKKVDGICSLNKIYGTGKAGDICYLRSKIFDNLVDMEKHSYGPVPYGANNYKGRGGSPSSKESLKIITNYKFCLALEPMYHSMWSWDWVTERMWNAFRAKTIPVYFGGYNIEDHVPTELFIDLRKYITRTLPIFDFDYQRLANDLNAMSKDQYIDMTEKAYTWQKTNRIGNIGDIDDVLARLP